MKIRMVVTGKKYCQECDSTIPRIYSFTDVFKNFFEVDD
jgi:hypothetical protein